QDPVGAGVSVLQGVEVVDVVAEDFASEVLGGAVVFLDAAGVVLDHVPRAALRVEGFDPVGVGGVGSGGHEGSLGVGVGRRLTNSISAIENSTPTPRFPIAET